MEIWIWIHTQYESGNKTTGWFNISEYNLKQVYIRLSMCVRPPHVWIISQQRSWWDGRCFPEGSLHRPGLEQLAAEHPNMSDPPPNKSCWRMLQAAWCSSLCHQTLSHLLHVLSVNLLSSVKSQRWICPFWFSLANANRSARCWADSTNPICGHWALTPPSRSLLLTVWVETCTLVVC